MEVILETRDVREAVNTCMVAVETGTISIEINGSGATLKTTDLESYIKTVIPCSASEALKACIPYKSLGQFVGKGEGKVIIEPLWDNRLTLKRPGIGMMNVHLDKSTGDFPPEPVTLGVEWHELSTQGFCRELTILLNGCVKDDSRPVLTAICCKDGSMSSADGFRLYEIKDDRLDFGLGEKEALMRWTTAQKIIRLFEKKDKVEIGFVKDRVCVRSGQTTLTSQLQQGAYPHYEQLIPATYQGRAVFSVPLMMERLQIINPSEITDGALRVNFLKTAKAEDVCELSVRGENVEYELSLPAKIESAEIGKIAVQLQYVKDAIKYFSLCQMEFTSPSSPMKFTGDIQGLTVVVMPMFIQWD